MAEKGKEVIQEVQEVDCEDYVAEIAEEEDFEDYVAEIAELLKDRPHFEIGSGSKDLVR
ncbi:hypothetical protein A2U01_0083004 [Trifolium medium]|uniref:Uncharacterized protein n=1 Tax=Trifolium medium TaxID=97028 RepID=A0A392TMS1_9FABA|nr:hypothetical protein [Trifolium medium]